jgi:hypothetical protein
LCAGMVSPCRSRPKGSMDKFLGIYESFNIWPIESHQ